MILAAQGKFNNITEGYSKTDDIEEELFIMYRKRKRNAPFAQFEQRKELLDLTPYACKVLVYIALTIGYNAQQVKIEAIDVDMDRRTLSNALVDLMMHGVIRKADKPHMFWVNVTLLIVGTLSK